MKKIAQEACSDPEFITRRTIAVKESLQRPEVQKKLSQRALDVWADPEMRAFILQRQKEGREAAKAKKKELESV